MFKCKECGAEYNVKPDYCDCGNDTFDIISDIKNTQTQIKQTSIPSIKPNTKKNTTKNSPAKQQKNPDYISFFIFGICVILSILILFFIGNPKEISVEEQPQKIAENNSNIPSIDTYWDNTPVKPFASSEATIQESQTPTIVEEIKQIINIPKKTEPQIPKVQPQKQTSKTTTNKTISKQTLQKTATKKTSNSQPKTNTLQPKTTANDYSSLASRVQQNAQNSIQNKTQSLVAQTSTKPITQTQTPPQIRNNQTSNSSASASNAQTQAPTQIKTNTKTQEQIKKELNTYKASLRNTIGRKINFSRVIGDGECAVTFKIDSQGRLTNRVFARQSSNLTLNDEVFSAVNSTPSYNPPPDGYRGETLTLRIKFYDGNFEISLN